MAGLLVLGENKFLSIKEIGMLLMAGLQNIDLIGDGFIAAIVF